MIGSLRDYKSGDILYAEYIGYDPCVGVEIGVLKLTWMEYCKAVLFVYLQVSKQEVPTELQRVLRWLEIHEGWGEYILAENTELSSEEKITHSTGEFILSVNESREVVFGPYRLNLNEFCLVTKTSISGKEGNDYRTMPVAVRDLWEKLRQKFQLLPDKK